MKISLCYVKIKWKKDIECGPFNFYDAVERMNALKKTTPHEDFEIVEQIVNMESVL